MTNQVLENPLISSVFGHWGGEDEEEEKQNKTHTTLQCAGHRVLQDQRLEPVLCSKYFQIQKKKKIETTFNRGHA